MVHAPGVVGEERGGEAAVESQVVDLINNQTGETTVSSRLFPIKLLPQDVSSKVMDGAIDNLPTIRGIVVPLLLSGNWQGSR